MAVREQLCTSPLVWLSTSAREKYDDQSIPGARRRGRCVDGDTVGRAPALYEPDQVPEVAARRVREVEAHDPERNGQHQSGAFFWVILQIIIIDMVFSLDSIITAIGMAQDLEIMIAAVVIACVIMYASSGPVARFVADHPTTKMLALAFLVLIGVALVADGFKFHIPRGYIYFAIAFSAAVEFFNVLARRNRRGAAN